MFFRTEDGTPVALEDRCPHRRLPLSMGKLIGDDVCNATITACASTRPASACASPARTMIPRTAQGEILSGGRALQLALGLDGRSGAGRSRQDPRLSIGSTIRTGAPKSDYLYVQCNWQLINDNLLDLTHLAFVHETTIGNMALVEHAAVKVQRTPTGVR